MRDSLHSYAHGAIPFVHHANRIMENFKSTGDDSDALNRLLELDDLYDKMTLNHVTRRASKSQGVALLTLYSRGFSLPPILRQSDGTQPEGEDKTSHLVDALKLKIRQGHIPGHLPICWGVLTSGLGLSSGTCSTTDRCMFIDELNLCLLIGKPFCRKKRRSALVPLRTISTLFCNPAEHTWAVRRSTTFAACSEAIGSRRYQVQIWECDCSWDKQDWNRRRGRPRSGWPRKHLAARRDLGRSTRFTALQDI